MNECKESNKAISPRLAINIELSEIVGDWGLVADVRLR